ncbi:hypothetical protein E1263_23260 [Kribbella antibiotica]|uniref:Uncharacterized protein n=1 Tax=Kribbella antibiotica TaxID=190195 RepID=A0A4R4ZIG7_9ACTN|nr:hypothetical protein [Kribbella antibiotica]TDD57514.1 hypothetical protein E1263_23260 [Kribbella antibiotica]
MTDLKDLLRSAAAEAENVSVDGSALIPTIRRRRRVRTAAVGVGSAAAVTTLAVTAYAVLPGASDAPVSGGSPTALPTFQAKDCKVEYARQPTVAGRKVALTQKTMRPTGELAWSGTVEVTVTNTSKVTLYTKNTPALFHFSPEQRFESRVGSVQAVAQKNVVLKPGAAHTSTVRVTIQGCASWKQPAGSFSVHLPTTGDSQLVGRLQLP